MDRSQAVETHADLLVITGTPPVRRSRNGTRPSAISTSRRPDLVEFASFRSRRRAVIRVPDAQGRAEAANGQE